MDCDKIVKSKMSLSIKYMTIQIWSQLNYIIKLQMQRSHSEWLRLIMIEFRLRSDANYGESNHSWWKFDGKFVSALLSWIMIRRSLNCIILNFYPLHMRLNILIGQHFLHFTITFGSPATEHWFAISESLSALFLYFLFLSVIKNDPMNAVPVMATKTHCEIVSGFSSAMNGARMVKNRANKLPIANVVETSQISNMY